MFIIDDDDDDDVTGIKCIKCLFRVKPQACLTEEQEANDILGYQTNTLPSLATCANSKNSPNQILSKVSYLFWLLSFKQDSYSSVGKDYCP